MRWKLLHKRNHEREPVPGELPPDVDVVFDAHVADEVFTCTTCGRADLPEAGDWDPPICLECDAAINNDALEEEIDHGIW
jgi:hypothetical protein